VSGFANPSFGTSGGAEPDAVPSEPTRPLTLHHLTINHILHSHITWIWDIPLFIVLVMGAVLGYLLTRRSPRRLWVAAALALLLLTASGALALVAFHQVPGPGIYRVHPIEVVGEDHDSAGNRIIEEERRIDHYRPPLDVNIALVLASALLVQLSLPSIRVLAAAERRRRRLAREARRAKARPPLRS
jgi:hypothetical protein